MDAREAARRLLPWVLAPRFHNVVTSVTVRGDKAVSIRNVELYATSVGDVMVPGAGLMLYVPYLNAEYQVRMSGRDRGYVIVTRVEGFVSGFMPNGGYAKFTERAFAPGVVGRRIEFTGAAPSDFTVTTVVRRLARIESAKLFAAKVKNVLSKDKWFFEHIGIGSVKTVYITEGNAKAEVVVRTNFFRAYYRDTSITAPGIIPAVLGHFASPELEVVEDDRVRETIIDFLERVSSVGRNFTTINILQKATRSTFMYAIGEAEVPDSVAEEAKRAGRRLLWVTGSPTYTGVRSNIYVDVETKKVLLSLTFVPFVPPASLVLNYPPFHIAPLAAMVNERMKQLRFFAEVVPERLEKRGIDATLYADELEPLADAGVKFDDVRRIMREGYPKLDSLERLLEKMERVEDIGDIASMTYGAIRKIDELIISEIRPGRARREEAEGQEKDLEELTL